jgi:hypothetical protein
MIAKGNVELVLYGVYSWNNALPSPTPVASNINVRTYVSGGKTDLYLIDSSALAYSLGYSQYTFTDVDTNAARDVTRVLKMRNVRLSETNQAFSTELLIDFHLPDYKTFHATDLLQINLGDAAYVTNAGIPLREVYCEIVDITDGKYIPQFRTCNADNLADIQIVASEDTNVSSFTLKLTNFEVPSTAVIDPLNQDS